MCSVRPADMWPFLKSKGDPCVFNGTGKHVAIFKLEGKSYVFNTCYKHMESYHVISDPNMELVDDVSDSFSVCIIRGMIQCGCRLYLYQKILPVCNAQSK
jgi:hypothetical protein